MIMISKKKFHVDFIVLSDFKKLLYYKTTVKCLCHHGYYIHLSTIPVSHWTPFHPVSQPLSHTPVTWLQVSPSLQCPLHCWLQLTPCHPTEHSEHTVSKQGTNIHPNGHNLSSLHGKMSSGTDQKVTNSKNRIRMLTESDILSWAEILIRYTCFFLKKAYK